MRHHVSLIATLLAAASLGLAGCDVRKTEEGNVTLPKYEVSKTQEGNVNLPKYDVTAPDVDVKSKQVEVTVPKVTTEKETVTVPSIDVKTADEKKREEGKK
jgi:predicted RecA/RadA family phage recombinase